MYEDFRLILFWKCKEGLKIDITAQTNDENRPFVWAVFVCLPRKDRPCEVKIKPTAKGGGLKVLK